MNPDTQTAITHIEKHINNETGIPIPGHWPDAKHYLDAQSAHALIAALSCGRPLLVSGEPGVGKSQLAQAAAQVLGRRFLSYVVQPDSEYQELLWSFDHTRRLADAQIGEKTRVAEVRNYIGPGALWWAFHWKSAKARAAKAPYYTPQEYDKAPCAETHGAVLLVDEIDKADISLANSLLEALGNGGFAVPPLGHSVCAQTPAPLLMFTSNNTRQLPAAFVRRCVVLKLELPEDIHGHFCKIGAMHFPALHEDLLKDAAEQIIADRNNCRGAAKTGLAEYLDLLRALNDIDETKRADWLEKLAAYFQKSQAV